jgi:hypothetical protein
MYIITQGSGRQQMDKNRRKDLNRICADKQMNILFAVGIDNSLGTVPEKVIIKNISKGGLCVVSDTGIGAGTVIAAEIILDGAGKESVKVYCEAKWTRKPSKNHRHETGMEFICFRGNGENLLKEFIDNYSEN